MKDSKFCHATSGCWGHRHELLGLILLVIATLLTIVSANSFGIVAMFVVGVVLCCYRYCSFNCHCPCHSSGECGDQNECSTEVKKPQAGHGKKAK